MHIQNLYIVDCSPFSFSLPLCLSLCIAVDCLRPMNNDDDATVAVDDDYEETESFFATFKKQDRMKIPPTTITKKYWIVQTIDKRR